MRSLGYYKLALYFQMQEILEEQNWYPIAFFVALFLAFVVNKMVYGL